jgi:intracellular multiplication protein IcmP
MARNGQGQSDGMGMVWVCLIGLPIAFGWMCWYRWHGTISYSALKWVWYQLAVFDWPFMPDIIREWRAQAAAMAMYPKQVTLAQLLKMLNIAGYFFIPIPLLLIVRGFLAAHRHPMNKTRRKVTIETLPWIMSKHSPSIIPSLYYGDPKTLLLNDDPVEHRSAQHSEEWALEHGLIVNQKLDRDRCRQLLVDFLGKPVTKLDQLNPTERAMFAVFGARLLSDGKDISRAQTLLDDLNRSCHTNTFEGKKGYPDLTIADAAFNRYAAHPDAQAWMLRHPYPRTMLLAMQKRASKSGKLPSSQFRWLKGMDRSLFYALNTGLRKAPFLEAAAVFTQMLWEEYAEDVGYRLTEPFVDDAVDGIEKYLAKLGLIDLPGDAK